MYENVKKKSLGTDILIFRRLCFNPQSQKCFFHTTQKATVLHDNSVIIILFLNRKYFAANCRVKYNLFFHIIDVIIFFYKIWRYKFI